MLLSRGIGKNFLEDWAKFFCIFCKKSRISVVFIAYRYWEGWSVLPRPRLVKGRWSYCPTLLPAPVERLPCCQRWQGGDAEPKGSAVLAMISKETAVRPGAQGRFTAGERRFAPISDATNLRSHPPARLGAGEGRLRRIPFRGAEDVRKRII